MVVVAQLVRAPDCGSGGRRFETDLPPESKNPCRNARIFSFIVFCEKYEHTNLVNAAQQSLMIRIGYTS